MLGTYISCKFKKELIIRVLYIRIQKIIICQFIILFIAYTTENVYLAGNRPFATSGNANAPTCKTDVRLKEI